MNVNALAFVGEQMRGQCAGTNSHGYLSSSFVQTIGKGLGYPEFTKFYFESLPFRRATHQTDLALAALREVSKAKHAERKTINGILNPNRIA